MRSLAILVLVVFGLSAAAQICPIDNEARWLEGKWFPEYGIKKGDTTYLEAAEKGRWLEFHANGDCELADGGKIKYKQWEVLPSHHVAVYKEGATREEKQERALRFYFTSKDELVLVMQEKRHVVHLVRVE